jgi:endonuclease YncB( thermonuclease family)
MDRKMRRTVAALAVILAGLGIIPAHALTLTGTAEVIDADLLLLDGHRVFLLGVESVEEGQLCGIDNQAWECWPAAVRMLQTIAGEGEMTCEVISGPNFLSEVIAICTVGGEDVGARLVRSGFGLPIPEETDAYRDEMEAAQSEHIGLWQGTFYTPAEWRALNNRFADRPAFRPLAPVPNAIGP